MSYVYLLSSYDEHGAENVVATLDRDRLPELLEKAFDHPSWHVWEYAPLLQELLAQSDEKLSDRSGGYSGDAAGTSGHNLGKGWGGLMLHVVPLDKPL